MYVIYREWFDEFCSMGYSADFLAQISEDQATHHANMLIMPSDSMWMVPGTCDDDEM